ncbi:hypothetical protein Tco_1141879, partial [Tanacetum coccineum]
QWSDQPSLQKWCVEQEHSRVKGQGYDDKDLGLLKLIGVCDERLILFDLKDCWTENNGFKKMRMYLVAIMEEHRETKYGDRHIGDKKKLAERREQMAIRAYEEEKRRAELNQKIEEDKKREEWNRKIEGMINIIQSFIQNPISSVQTPQPVTTKVPAVTTTVPAKPIQNSPCYDDLTSYRNKKTTKKGVSKEGFGFALNKSMGSHLGL